MQLRNRSIGIGRTFYLFRRLAIELQYAIWKFALEPRIVELKWGWINEDDAHEEGSPSVHYLNTCATLPITFRVCRGSINAVLPFYPFCFGSENTPSMIRFNGSLDTFYLNQYSLPQQDTGEEFLHESII